MPFKRYTYYVHNVNFIITIIIIVVIIIIISIIIIIVVLLLLLTTRKKNKGTNDMWSNKKMAQILKNTGLENAQIS